MKYFAKQYDVNATGRDFVIGDLHGSYSRLTAFMDHIEFDKTKDRIFSVGDLIDRGPDSQSCLRLKNEPWFHTVYANHEDLAEHFLASHPLGQWWMANGGNWWYDLSTDEQQEVKDLIDVETPVLATVAMSNGKKFHVIHAEIYSDEELTDASLISNIREIASLPSADGDAIIWGRAMFRYLYDTQLNPHTLSKYSRMARLEKLSRFMGPELSHIYSGHSVMRAPLRYMGQTNLDTGAYKSYGKNPQPYQGLTITEPLTDKFWLSNHEDVKENKYVTID